jgi:hypothetical protein
LLSDFYRHNTLATNALEFLNKANKFATGDLMDAALEQFAYTLHTQEYVEIDQLEPDFLLRALQKRHQLSLTSNRWDSENISCLIALCTLHYKDRMSRSLFYKLTDARYIPFIDQEAALQLLTTETELKYWEDSNNFSSLQGRCLQSLLKDWEGLIAKFESDTAFWKALRAIDGGVLAFLLMHATRMKDSNVHNE